MSEPRPRFPSGESLDAPTGDDSSDCTLEWGGASVEAEHTPGPWTTTLNVRPQTDFTRHIKVKAECDWTIAEVRFWDQHKGGGQTAKANARLIAAAPELLAQCEYARSFLEGFPDSPGAERLVRTIGAVIAKAKRK